MHNLIIFNVRLKRTRCRFYVQKNKTYGILKFNVSDDRCIFLNSVSYVKAIFYICVIKKFHMLFWHVTLE